MREEIGDLAPIYRAALKTAPADTFERAAGVARENEFGAFLEKFPSRSMTKEWCDGE